MMYWQAAIQFIVTRPIEALANLPKKIIHLYLLETTAAQSLFLFFSFVVKFQICC
jgi:hypothetical protein